MKAKLPILALVTLAATAAAWGKPIVGDAAKGRAVFARCVACHDVATGVSRLGPSLKGIVGRRAGTSEGYRYSAALKGSRVTWNAISLEAFLAAPTRFVPGSRMFVAVSDPHDRADVIAYLSTVR